MLQLLLLIFVMCSIRFDGSEKGAYRFWFSSRSIYFFFFTNFFSFFFVVDKDAIQQKSRNKSRLCVCVSQCVERTIVMNIPNGNNPVFEVIIWWAKQKTFCTWLVVLILLFVFAWLVVSRRFHFLKIYRLSNSIKLCQENNRTHLFRLKAWKIHASLIRAKKNVYKNQGFPSCFFIVKECSIHFISELFAIIRNKILLFFSFRIFRLFFLLFEFECLLFELNLDKSSGKVQIDAIFSWNGGQ